MRITQQELKDMFDVDQTTGTFYRRHIVGRQNKFVGEPAGSHHSRGYIHIYIGGTQYKAHRLMWLFVHGEWPPEGLDHINGVPWDNRIENLRLACQTVNNRNAARRSDNTSGVPGVSWSARGGAWVVQTGLGGSRRDIKKFSSFFDACCYRKSMELKLGYTGRLNG